MDGREEIGKREREERKGKRRKMRENEKKTRRGKREE